MNNQDLVNIKNFIISILDFSYGCTEPAAIALNGAKTKEIINEKIIRKENVKLYFFIDKMTYKNAFNVGLPGVEFKGILESYLAGFLFGDSKDKLEIFNSINKENFYFIKKLIENDYGNDYDYENLEKEFSNNKILNSKIDKKLIKIAKNIKIRIIDNDTLFLGSLLISDDNDIFIVKTEKTHENLEVKQINNFENDILKILKEVDSENIKDSLLNKYFKKLIKENKALKTYKKDEKIELRKKRNIYCNSKWDYLLNYLFLDEVIREKILNGAIYNALASYEKNDLTTLDDFFVSSAIYNRMIGKKLKILSCAKSGNKGLTALASTLNYYLFNYKKDLFFNLIDNYSPEKREEYFSILKKVILEDEKLFKALILSCLITGLITYNFGFISSICGVVYSAGAGFLGAMLYLDNKINLFDNAYINYISSFGGIFCDGAKGSCASRGYVSVKAALKAKDLSYKNFSFNYKDGYLGKDFYETIKNLSKFNRIMNQINTVTIQILEKKS